MGMFILGVFCGSVATFGVINYIVLTKVEEEMAKEEHEVGSLK